MKYNVTIRYEENGKTSNYIVYNEKTTEPLTVKDIKEKCLDLVKKEKTFFKEEFEKDSEEIYLRSGRRGDPLKDEEVLDRSIHERIDYYLKIKTAQAVIK